jgi:hypothetical protein
MRRRRCSRPGCVTRTWSGDAGHSTRRYGAALEPVVDLPAKGTSKSTVSAKFVAATTERLAGLNRRPLDDQRWLIIFIDGFVRHEAPHDRVEMKGLHLRPVAAGREKLAAA